MLHHLMRLVVSARSVALSTATVKEAARSTCKQGVDTGRVFCRGSGHHDGVCTVGRGVHGDDQQDDLVAVSVQDSQGVGRLAVVTVESDDLSANRSLSRRLAHSARSYVTRATAPRRTDSTASRSGSSVGRSSLRGHHAPSTYPVIGALRFKRSRGVCSGPEWRRPEAAPFSRCAMGRSCLSLERPKSFESATTQSQMVACDIPPMTQTLHPRLP